MAIFFRALALWKRWRPQPRFTPWRNCAARRIAIESPATTVRFDTSIPFSLMVGTLEPRKGHADILAAFSELWRQGAENRLVLVGRMGWQIEDLRDAIRMHPEYGVSGGVIPRRSRA